MKTALSILSVFIFSTSFAQSTFKHDIGIRLGNGVDNKLQLQYRWHKNEKWAFGTTASIGNKGTGNYHMQLEAGDSTYFASSYNYQRMYYSLNFSAIRKLNFMKHNFYYAGASMGVGGFRFSYFNHWARYTAESMDPTMAMPPIGELLESEQHHTIFNGMSANAKIFIGADVPILDRLCFNFELGTSLRVAEYANFSGLFVDWLPAVSGGLRYRFGKTDPIKQ